MIKNLKQAFLFTFLLCNLFPLFGQNADANFGIQGMTATAFNSTDDMRCVSARQTDGKTVVAGFVSGTSEIAVTRYLSNGQLDLTFSDDGKFTTPIVFSTISAPQLDINILANGRILVMISNANDRFYLYRLTNSGALDPTFSGVGFKSFLSTQFPVTTIRNLVRMKVQLDGKILIAGKGKVSATLDGFLVARILADGSAPDNLFSGDGVALVDPFLFGSEARDLIIQSNGAILVGGSVRTSAVSGNFFGVLQLTASGLPTNLNGNSSSSAYFTSGDFKRFALQADGKILLAGEYSSGASLRLQRLLANFTVDNTFGTSGYASVNWGTISGDNNKLTGFITLTNGKIVVAGTLYRATGNQVRMTQLNSDGTPVLTFGTQGTTSGFFGAGSVQCNSFDLLPDGTVILTGSRKISTLFDQVITRWYLQCTRFIVINKLLCGGEVYTFKNQTFSQTGTYQIITSNGSCDSSFTLNITKYPLSLPSVSISTNFPMPLCGGSPVTFVANVDFGGTNPTYKWKKDINTIVATTPTYTTNSSLLDGSMISLSITSNQPCAVSTNANSNFIEVTTLPAPVLTITQSNGQLTCTFLDGVLYQWVRCLGSNYEPVGGATGQNFSPSQNGSFAVEVTSGNCVTRSNCVPFTFTENNRLIGNPADVLYPNPAGNSFKPGFLVDKTTDFQILNATGSRILSGRLLPGQEEIDVQNLPAGLYTLWTNQTGFRKFVKD